MKERRREGEKEGGRDGEKGGKEGDKRFVRVGGNDGREGKGRERMGEGNEWIWR